MCDSVAVRCCDMLQDIGCVRFLNKAKYPYACELLGVYRDPEHTYVRRPVGRVLKNTMSWDTARILRWRRAEVVTTFATEGDLFSWCEAGGGRNFTWKWWKKWQRSWPTIPPPTEGSAGKLKTWGISFSEAKIRQNGKTRSGEAAQGGVAPGVDREQAGFQMLKWWLLDFWRPRHKCFNVKVRFTTKAVQPIARQIMEGVQQLHDFGIARGTYGASSVGRFRWRDDFWFMVMIFRYWNTPRDSGEIHQWCGDLLGKEGKVNVRNRQECWWRSLYVRRSFVLKVAPNQGKRYGELPKAILVPCNISWQPFRL